MVSLPVKNLGPLTLRSNQFAECNGTINQQCSSLISSDLPFDEDACHLNQMDLPHRTWVTVKTGQKKKTSTIVYVGGIFTDMPTTR